MTNKLRTTLYIGVTADLYSGIQEHKQHFYKGSFTDKYNLEICVYYENYPFIAEAINREKRLKMAKRKERRFD